MPGNNENLTTIEKIVYIPLFGVIIPVMIVWGGSEVFKSCSEFNPNRDEGRAKIEAIDEVSIVKQIFELEKSGKIGFVTRDRLLKILEKEEIQTLRIRIFSKMVLNGKISQEQRTYIIDKNDNNGSKVVLLNFKPILPSDLSNINYNSLGKLVLDKTFENETTKVPFQAPQIPKSAKFGTNQPSK